MRFLFLILLFPFLSTDVEQKTEPSGFDAKAVCISKQEKELVKLINQYRKKHNLKAIPVSSSLSYVAQKHAKELNDKIKDLTHSWVDCDYDGKNRKTYNCMWDMPKKLTGYPGKGYECGFAQWGQEFSAADILEGWQNSRGHDNVIINKATWKKMEWNAMGVAIYGNYATLWFGRIKDPKGSPKICN